MTTNLMRWSNNTQEFQPDPFYRPRNSITSSTCSPNLPSLDALAPLVALAANDAPDDLDAELPRVVLVLANLDTALDLVPNAHLDGFAEEKEGLFPVRRGRPRARGEKDLAVGFGDGRGALGRVGEARG